MKFKIKTPLVLDVSAWQGSVNWSQISPRPVLVICKASEGTRFLDPTLANNWSALKALNIRRGAYHYFRAEMDAVKQFETYQKAVMQVGGLLPDDLPPILDVEGFENTAPGLRRSASAGIKTWLDNAQAFYARTPMIYTSKYEWSLLGAVPAWSSNYPLWVAWYPDEADKFGEPASHILPDGWKKWAIWQYAKNGKVDGLQSQVDLNILSESFAKQLDPHPAPPAPSDPPAERHIYRGTIVAPRGVNVRVKPDIHSKPVGALVVGTLVRGETIKVASPHEAWIEITEPLAGWCAVVYDGTTLISVSQTGVTMDQNQEKRK